MDKRGNLKTNGYYETNILTSKTSIKWHILFITVINAGKTQTSTLSKKYK